MEMKYIFPLLATICLFVFVKAYAQKTKPIPETSVYLSTDIDIYIAGEFLLYNAFILETQTLKKGGTKQVFPKELMSV